MWENTALTNKGRTLQSKLTAGNTLKITSVKSGAGKVSVLDMREQTEVQNIKQELTLQSVVVKNTQAELFVLLENVNLEDSYELWQVGIYAEDPDEGEILYCLSQAKEGKLVPCAKESPGFSITWKFQFEISDDVPIEVNINPSGLIPVETLEEKIKEIRENVHGEIAEVKTNFDGQVAELDNEIDQANKKFAGYLPLSGGIISGNMYLNQGFNVFVSGDGSGSQGYILMAELSVTEAYMNSPIKLEIARRGDIFTTDIYIQFANDSGTDPAVGSFWYDNRGMRNINIFLYKAETSKWNLYIAKSESYDHIAILNVQKNFGYMNGVQIKYKGAYANGVPSGSIQCKNWGDSGWIDCSMGNGISPHSGTYNRPQVRRIEKIVHLRGCVTNSTTWTEHSNIITIPDGYRPSVSENFVQQGSGSNKYLLNVTSGGACNAQRYSNNTTMSNTVPTGSWLNMYATWFID